MSHTLVEVNGWWVHPNWHQPEFDAVLLRAKQGKMVRSPRINYTMGRT